MKHNTPEVASIPVPVNRSSIRTQIGTTGALKEVMEKNCMLVGPSMGAKVGLQDGDSVYIMSAALVET